MITWTWKTFNELSTLELYKILQLRAEVFVVEQQDIYLDPDNKDLNGWHLMGWEENQKLIAYARVVLPTMEDEAIKFGRVCVAQDYRKLGLGRELIIRLIDRIQNSEYANHKFIIEAQAYLEKVYEKAGFIREGEVYMDGTIPHIKMVYIKEKN